MKRLSLLVVSAAAALAAAGVASADRGSRPAEPAGAYMVSVVKQKLADEYALAWQTLYPPHQRVAPREAYASCESLTPGAGTLLSVRALRTFNERIVVAGKRGRILTKAIDVRVSVVSPYVLFPVVIEQTFHAIAVRGSWRWILSADQYAYYSDGECPYA